MTGFTRNPYRTLEHVAQEARPYPDHLLEGCETGLALFAAAFTGHNDSIHYALHGMTATCVDIDEDALDAMRGIYPDEWEFIVADAFSWALEAASGPYKWDAVSVDTFTGDAERQSLGLLPLWCRLARKLVTVTATAGASFDIPEGWDGYRFERATGVYWLVLTPA